MYRVAVPVRLRIFPWRSVESTRRVFAVAATFDEPVTLESIFPGKALLAMETRERLYGQMNTLMPLQVVVAVERLRAGIALEWSVLLGWGLTMTVHAMVRAHMLTVTMGHR